MVPGDREREVNELIMVGWVSSLVNFGILQFGIDNLKSFNIIHMFINPYRVKLIESDQVH
jgi:hypothetical protein